jgi:hypothetical protein
VNDVGLNGQAEPLTRESFTDSEVGGWIRRRRGRGAEPTRAAEPTCATADARHGRSGSQPTCAQADPPPPMHRFDLG